MASTELLSSMLGINPKIFSRQENFILEIDLFTKICEELKEYFRDKYKYYFNLINLNIKMEDEMLEKNFLKFVINDVLITEEYSLLGIAYYTQIPEDVINDIMIGINYFPSFHASRKIIDLHRAVKPDIYKKIMEKIAKNICQQYKSDCFT